MISVPITASVLISVSSNIDNVGVGVAYGIKGIRIPLTSNVFIAVITGMGTFFSMMAGGNISQLMSMENSKFISGLLLACLGVASFIPRNEYFHNKKIKIWIVFSNKITNCNVIRRVSDAICNPLLADNDNSGHIDMMECIFLSVALSMNNIANGVAAGMAGLNIFVTTIFVIIFSVIAIFIGVGAGVRFRSLWISKNSAKISGVILICMGSYEVFS